MTCWYAWSSGRVPRIAQESWCSEANGNRVTWLYQDFSGADHSKQHQQCYSWAWRRHKRKAIFRNARDLIVIKKMRPGKPASCVTKTNFPLWPVLSEHIARHALEGVAGTFPFTVQTFFQDVISICSPPKQSAERSYFRVCRRRVGRRSSLLLT